MRVWRDCSTLSLGKFPGNPGNPKSFPDHHHRQCHHHGCPWIGMLSGSSGRKAMKGASQSVIPRWSEYYFY